MKIQSLILESRYKLLLVLVFSFSICYSQKNLKKGYFPFVENWNIIDSLKNNTGWIVTRDSLWRIEEIELERQAKEYALELIKRKYITFPFQNEPIRSLTSKLLFRRKYNIHFDRDIREDSDNIKGHYYIYYKTMREYLLNKYGKTFFMDVFHNSNQLDSNNKGLNLPIIINKQTNSTLHSLLDSTLKSIKEIYSLNYPFVAFTVNKKRKIYNVYVGSTGLPGLQKDSKVPEDLNMKIQLVLNSCNWKYPTFKGKFENKEVAYLFETKEFIFMPFYE